MIVTGEYSVIFKSANGFEGDVTVILSLYNYEGVVRETLESVAAQTVDRLSLVVVEDRSSDNSLTTCLKWLENNADRFARALLLQHRKNCGLSTARNTAFSVVTTPSVFVVDADNHLYPRAVERCQEALSNCDAAFAYPILEVFGDEQLLMGTDLWSRDKLAEANYIDAMALIRKECWEAVEGYTVMPHGWEDYDLWCKFAGREWWGVRVPEILARYRVHRGSMLRTRTNKSDRIRMITKDMRRRHPWIRIH